MTYVINFVISTGICLEKKNIHDKSFLLCEVCFDSEKLNSEQFSKDDFEMANFFNIINPSESKL